MLSFASVINSPEATHLRRCLENSSEKPKLFFSLLKEQVRCDIKRLKKWHLGHRQDNLLILYFGRMFLVSWCNRFKVSIFAGLDDFFCPSRKLFVAKKGNMEINENQKSKFLFTRNFVCADHTRLTF